MNKRGIIVIAIIAVVALVTVVAVVLLNLFEQPALHSPYLRAFLSGTELTFGPVVRNNFTYYELHSADKKLAGFVFLGTEQGFGSPINLFVKTDTAGIIRRVYVWRHRETPEFVVGLDAFLATFANKTAEAELVWQRDVHGITGATRTAEAIIVAVRETGRAAYQRRIFIRGE